MMTRIVRRLNEIGYDSAITAARVTALPMSLVGADLSLEVATAEHWRTPLITLDAAIGKIDPPLMVTPLDIVVARIITPDGRRYWWLGANDCSAELRGLEIEFLAFDLGDSMERQ
jgi:hypothetical protein